LPLKTAYKFTRLIKRAEVELEFYNERFQEIVKEYAEKDENGQYKIIDNGQSIAIIPGKESECNAKLLELRNLEVVIDDIKFTIDELEKIDISIENLMCIMPLIED
jgi:3-deoxy-D-manno-octulosonate 8-phosphate phosphatase KdsC-like HAD superfamily phosphatase